MIRRAKKTMRRPVACLVLMGLTSLLIACGGSVESVDPPAIKTETPAELSDARPDPTSGAAAGEATASDDLSDRAIREAKAMRAAAAIARVPPSHEIEWTGGAVLRDRMELREVRAGIGELLEASDFAGLERVREEVGASGRWTLEGKPLHSVFYETIEDSLRSRDHHYQAVNLKFLERWRRAFRESPAPRTLIARLHVICAWRGGKNLPEEMNAEAKEQHYARHHKAAHQALSDAYRERVYDIETIRIHLDVARGASYKAEDQRAVIEGGIRMDPTYFPLYRAYVLSLFPRWGGSPEKFAAFCEEMGDRVGGDDGAILYARLVGHGLEANEPAEFLRASPLDWERIHEGYRAVIGRYPHSRALAHEYYRICRTVENVDGQDWVLEHAARTAGVDLEAEGRRRAWVAQGRELDGSLHEAARRGDAPFAVALLRAGADPFSRSEFGWSAEELARKAGHVKLVKQLEEARAGMTLPYMREALSLYDAVRWGQLDRLRELIDEGADVNGSQEGWPIVHEAVRADDPEILRTLLGAGATPDAHAEDGWTPLLVACQRGAVDHANLLLKHKADPNLKTKDGRSPLHIAAKTGSLPIFLDLLAHGAELERRESQEWPLLHTTAEFGSTDVMEFLLELGVEPGTREPTGRTALHMAAGNNEPEAVRVLLKHGADRDAVYTYKGVAWSSIGYAAVNGCTEAVRVLLEAGCDANEVMDSRNILGIAADKGRPETVELLLQHGADPNLGFLHNGRTPLFRAAQNGHLDVARVLVAAKGVDLNAADHDGNTPLHVAGFLGMGEVVDLLMEAGADTTLRNTIGFTAAEAAGAAGHPEIAERMQYIREPLIQLP